MIRYFSGHNGIRAIEQGQEFLIQPGWVELTEAEVQEAINPPIPIMDLATAKRTEIETARKATEADGVTVNGIRYSGDADNRTAIREALEFAEAMALTTFASWKDSDNVFHTDHPVADVQAALMAIATRRGQLIAHEGTLVAQVQAALDANDRAGIEAVAWTTPAAE